MALLDSGIYTIYEMIDLLHIIVNEHTAALGRSTIKTLHWMAVVPRSLIEWGSLVLYVHF